MRIAAIYDIHGNLPALEAVLEETRREEVDQIVVGGDIVPGPMPRETLAMLLDLDIPVQYVRGNGEDAVAAEMQGSQYPGLPEQAREAARWTAQQLDAEHAESFASWPKTLRMHIHGLGDVLFCHATPLNNTDIFTRLTPHEALLPLFDNLDVATVVCGHTHMQFDRLIGTVRVVNAGSVGMPFGSPGADWLLLGPEVELRHTAYDFTNAAERIRGTTYPQAEEFAASNILQPPAEDEMVEFFTKAALK